MSYLRQPAHDCEGPANRHGHALACHGKADTGDHAFRKQLYVFPLLGIVGSDVAGSGARLYTSPGPDTGQDTTP